MTEQTLPEPGTPEAVAQGCLCDMIDEEQPDNDRWPQFKVRRCPLHGPAVQTPTTPPEAP